MIGVPFLSLAAVLLALSRIGRRDGHGFLWRIGALAAAVPPAAVVVLLTLDQTGDPFEQGFWAAFLASLYLSAPLAAIMIWVVAVSR